MTPTKLDFLLGLLGVMESAHTVAAMLNCYQAGLSAASKAGDALGCRQMWALAEAASQRLDELNHSA